MKTIRITHLFFILSIATLAVSCNLWAPKKSTEDRSTMGCASYEKEVMVIEVPIEECFEEIEEVELKVYPNSFSGYLNIHEEASSESAIIGKMHNGIDEATYVSLENEWCKIEWNDTIGYVEAKYLQQYPTTPVTSNVSIEWLTGIRKAEDATLLIFDDGTYLKYTHADFPYRSEVGLYRLEGDYVSFTRIAEINQQLQAEHSVYTYTLDINKKRNAVGLYCNKERIWDTYEQREANLLADQNADSDGPMWYYELTWTKEEFERDKRWTKQQIDKFHTTNEIPHFLISPTPTETGSLAGFINWLDNNNYYRYSGNDYSMESSSIEYRNNTFYFRDSGQTCSLSVYGSIHYDTCSGYGYATVIDDDMAEYGIECLYKIEIFPSDEKLYLIMNDTTFTFALY